MSRGRFVAGEAGLADDVADVLQAIVAKPRDADALAGDVATMRGRIEREKKAAGPFDVKLSPGGLMDCEFAAQFLVLSGIGRVEGETTLETLQRAAERGCIAPEDAETFILSTSLQTTLLQVMRIIGGRSFDAAQAAEAQQRALTAFADAVFRADAAGADRGGVASFEMLETRLVSLQARTRAAFARLVGRAVE
jgi:glutamate-ammonia-ligase adenylyltransferase